MLKCQGHGDLVVSSDGAVAPVDLAAGQQCTVDSGPMVGCDDGVTYEVSKVGNRRSTMLGGEGLVVHLTGPGRVYIQRRSPENFIDWLVPKQPTQRS